MKPYKTTLVAIFTLLFLAACSGGGSDNPADTGFIGGDQGLSLEFVNNAPPDTLADNGQQTFPVILRATNGGEERVNVSEATITLEGFSPRAFNTSIEALTKNIPEPIRANRISPGGDTIDSSPVLTEWEDFSYVEREVAGRALTMQARMCYEYGSTTRAELCVKNDMLSTSTDTCEIAGQRSYSSSGAPLKVTNVVQEPVTSDRTIVQFRIQNAGQGDVYRTGTECSDDSVNPDRNKVRMQLSGLEEASEVDCTGPQDLGNRAYMVRSNAEDLRNGHTVTCYITVPEEERNNRLQTFNVDLDYLYTAGAEKSVNIRNSVR